MCFASSGVLLVTWYSELLHLVDIEFSNLRRSGAIFPLFIKEEIASNFAEGDNEEELILHYVRLYASWKTKTPLGFLDCLGLYSAIINLQPSVIYLHTTNPTPFLFLNCEKLLDVTIKWPPIKTLVVTLHYVMNGQYIREIAHEADIYKLKAVEEYGGIVLDFDVLVINGSSLRNSLRSSECVICYEDQYGPLIANGGLLGCREEHARFPQLVLEESYKKNYHAGDWLYNSAILPWDIFQRHNDTATVLDGPCNHANGNWSGNYGTDNWTSLPAYHSYIHDAQARREKVLKWDSPVGEVARWLLPGSFNLSG
ncbi:hypothetical protein RvY_08636 [Ramazzottius varieornatus]|uniref:Alpha-1,4-N-acetylglucosaminyltransferase n=1 Tax=Ramazzottius varieornatus TaxID=947166 RepID=A0A1D1VC48_RAMVA|nr:hypothetical protein RvY_08636 [Ramazzottius varieornatus]